MKLFVASFVTLLLTLPQLGHGETVTNILMEEMLSEKTACLGVCIYENYLAIGIDFLKVCANQMTKLENFVGSLTADTSDDLSLSTISASICSMVNEVESLATCATSVVSGYCGEEGVKWFDSINSKLTSYLSCGSSASSLIGCFLDENTLPILKGQPDTCITDLYTPFTVNPVYEGTNGIYNTFLKNPKASNAICSIVSKFKSCMETRMATLSKCSGVVGQFTQEMDSMMGYIGCSSTENDALSCLANPATITNLNQTLSSVMSSASTTLNWCAISTSVTSIVDTIKTTCGERWTYKKMKMLKPSLVDYFNYKGDCTNEKSADSIVIGGCKCTWSDYALSKTSPGDSVTCGSGDPRVSAITGTMGYLFLLSLFFLM